MRVLAIENFVGTPRGIVGDAVRAAGADVDLRRAWQGEGVP